MGLQSRKVRGRVALQNMLVLNDTSPKQEMWPTSKRIICARKQLVEPKVPTESSRGRFGGRLINLKITREAKLSRLGVLLFGDLLICMYTYMYTHLDVSFLSWYRSWVRGNLLKNHQSMGPVF